MIRFNLILHGAFAFLIYASLIAQAVPASLDSAEISLYRNGFLDKQAIDRLAKFDSAIIDSNQIFAHVAPIMSAQKFVVEERPVEFANKFRPTFFVSPLHSSTFNEVWVDYSVNVNGNSCKPNIAIGPISDLALSQEPVWMQINFPDDPPQKKGFKFQISRLLDLSSNNKFYYSRNLDSLVYQVRSSLVIANKESVATSLKIYSDKDIERVNLVILYEGKKRLLEYPLPLREIGEGGAHINLDLLAGLKRLSPNFLLDTSYVHIKEIVVFTSEANISLNVTKPVNFLQIKSESRSLLSREVYLHLLETQQLGRNTSRAKFLLSKNLKLLNEVGGELNFRFFNKEGYISNACSQINNIRLVNSVEIVIPKFVSELKRWSQSVGGPFISNVDRYDHFEIPKILNWISLSGFSGKEANGRVDKIDGLPQDSSSRFSQGVRVTAKGRNISFPSNYSDLELNWDSLDFIKISWPLSLYQKDTENLYFVLKGPISRSGLDRFTLKISYDFGSPNLYEITPNAAFRLPMDIRKIVSAEVLVRLNHDIHNLKISGMGFFTPTIESVKGSFNNGIIPINVVLRPAPMTSLYSNNLKYDNNALIIPLNMRNSEFFTPINNELNWLSGIEIRYQLDSVFDHKAPELIISAKWDHGSVSKKIHLTRRDQTIWISGYLFSEPNKHLGALNGFEWKLANDIDSAGVNVAKISWKIHGVLQDKFSNNLTHSNFVLTDNLKVRFNSHKFNLNSNGLIFPLEIQSSELIQRLSEIQIQKPIALSDPMFYLTQLSLNLTHLNNSALSKYKTSITNTQNLHFFNLIFLFIAFSLIFYALFSIKFHPTCRQERSKRFFHNSIFLVRKLYSNSLVNLNSRTVKLALCLLIFILIALTSFLNSTPLISVLALLITYLSNQLLLRSKVFLLKADLGFLRHVYDHVSGTLFFVAILYTFIMIIALFYGFKIFAAMFSLVIFYSLLAGTYYLVKD